MGQVQRSNVWRAAVDTRGSACRVQQGMITLAFQAKWDHNQSGEFVCVSVISLADAVDRLLISDGLFFKLKADRLHLCDYPDPRSQSVNRITTSGTSQF